MQIENEHDKAIAYHDTIAPKMEEKSSKKSYSSSDITIERSIYFFYWLFKFARSVVVKSRSAFLSFHLHTMFPKYPLYHFYFISTKIPKSKVIMLK